MGLNRTMKIGETLYLQRGDEVIAFHIREFTQGEHAKHTGHLIKVNVLVDAPRSWDITHCTKAGASLKGRNHANNQRTNQEKALSQYEFTETPEEAAARKVRQEAIYSHKSDTPY